jgi:hypothetical protein
LIVVALFNVVFPERFKVDTNVEGLLKLIIEAMNVNITSIHLKRTGKFNDDK